MLRLLSGGYGLTGYQDGDTWRISIAPIDNVGCGAIIHRVIQASRTVETSHPDSLLYLITEDGNRSRLPPPSR